ncbi:hypothetical protein [Actinoplanes palleronii]|uniref:Uncharacterized protein n=1 Tax=Actinoplanes palleronii TaxID=113570 RepID=A0ABQ4BIR0_9ACTN|nr:hypothetical protein [Actinoplanes palleronii]GIE70566.1 hypothetical protein Apa02nite_066740 [Actinoplanes palleronii]
MMLTPLAGCQAGPETVDPASPRTLALTAGAVGSVPNGGPAATMQSELTALFGAPTRVTDVEPCLLAGPTTVKERALDWQNLTVTVASEAGAAETVAGWSVRPGALSTRLDLPYGVSTRTSVPDALSVIPDATGKYNDMFGLFEIFTKAEPDVFWTGDKPDGSGLITHITNHPQFCE